MEKLHAHMEPSSYQNVQDFVATHRDPERSFSSFEVFNPISLHFEEYDPVDFYMGSRIAYYARQAVFLACFNSPTHSILVKNNGDALISTRDLTDPAVFNSWMYTSWSLTHRED